MIHCVTIGTLILMVYVSYKEYKASPLLTSTETDSYRTVDIDFPGIEANTYFKLIFEL